MGLEHDPKVQDGAFGSRLPPAGHFEHKKPSGGCDASANGAGVMGGISQ
jgi:hypothetical protein